MWQQGLETAVSTVNIPKPRCPYLGAYKINKPAVQNSTRKHTKYEEEVKLDKQAHQDERQNVKLDSC